MALDCGERCVRKIQWLARMLCHRCFGEDCTYQHVTITEDLLNSMDTNLQSVVFRILSCFVFAFTVLLLGLFDEL